MATKATQKETPIDITKTVKTIEDALKIEGKKLSQVCHKDDTEDEKCYKQLKLITRVLNQGWKPNYNDMNERKWYVWGWIKASKSKPSGFGFSYSNYDYTYSLATVGSRLCFKSEELAQHAFKHFEALYAGFLTGE